MLELLSVNDNKPFVGFKTHQLLGNLPTVINSPATVNLGENLYAWGGQSNTSVSDNNSKRLNLDGGAAVNIPITPGLWYHTDAINIDEEFVLIFGGRRPENGNTNIIGKLVAGQSTWTDTGWRLPTITYGNKAVYDGNALIYVLSGGSSLFGAYNKTTGVRTALQNLPITVSGGVLFMHEGNVFHIGGWAGGAANNKVHKFTVGLGTWSEYQTYDAALYQSVNQGGHYYDGVCSYIGWSNNVLVAVRYDVNKKQFKRYTTNIGYRNCTGVIGKGTDLYMIGGSTIALGSSGFGAASSNRREIYKFSI